MSKVAFLVSFSPMTRVVVDVENPDDLTDDERSKIVVATREKMSESLGDYLSGETVDEMYPDTEIPYEEGEEN